MNKLLLACLFWGLCCCAYADKALVWQVKKIPMQTSNGLITLEALLLTPEDNKAHPVVLINHGSPRNAQERRLMKASNYLAMAKVFAQRGYSVALVLRRGYGSSGGGWAESYGDCSAPNYLHAAQAGVEDLHAVLAYLNQIPAFDTHNILVVGYSAGGFASLAFTAFNPPAGLRAAIVFAPGRGSYAADKVCQAQSLLAAFAQFGKSSRIPILWVSAENDHFFNPKLSRQFFDAFTQNGGQARFFLAPAFAQEGHFLFSNAGIPQWRPIVDEFLKPEALTAFFYPNPGHSSWWTGLSQ